VTERVLNNARECVLKSTRESAYESARACVIVRKSGRGSARESDWDSSAGSESVRENGWEVIFESACESAWE
jgi:hypothetical protein